MRKQYRIIENYEGYLVEMNSRFLSDPEFVRENWEDTWFTISHTITNLEDAKEYLENYKKTLKFSVVYEE